MDANYVKHTVGPVLNEAIANLLTHFVPNDPSNPNPIDFVGSYLLHHDALTVQLEADRKNSMELQMAKEQLLNKIRMEELMRREEEERMLEAEREKKREEERELAMQQQEAQRVELEMQQQKEREMLEQQQQQQQQQQHEQQQEQQQQQQQQQQQPSAPIEPAQ
ncbi:hypothetical protein HDV05_004741 [Chytridiales sp. JEL 0842]|nr:hypothetical protein HDV05_004741 [Chytridiales sp. JEL 0842]